jgi:hypothetical protein
MSTTVSVAHRAVTGHGRETGPSLSRYKKRFKRRLAVFQTRVAAIKLRQKREHLEHKEIICHYYGPLAAFLLC